MTPDFSYGDGRSYYVYLLLKYLKRAGINVILLTNGGDSFDRAEKEGIKIITADYLSNKSKYLKSCSLLKDLIKQYGIDIIHSHHRYYELIANSAAIYFHKKTKTVFTALSIVDKRYFVEYKSDKIIAVSNCVKEMLIRNFQIRKNKIEIINNFTDSEEETSASHENQTAYSKRERRINILTVGRLHKDKDQITILRALKIIGDDKIHLKIIGEGNEKNNLINFISKNKLNAEIIGVQKNLKKNFSEADICLLSSVRDPFPGFMLQSGIHGKAFIGSDSDGIPELITDRYNGLLFKKREPKSLAEAINLFINDDKLRKKCEMNLRYDVKNKYTEKTVIPEIINVYRNLI